MNSISQCAICKHYVFEEGLCTEYTGYIPREIFRNINECHCFVAIDKESKDYIKELFKKRKTGWYHGTLGREN